MNRMIGPLLAAALLAPCTAAEPSAPPEARENPPPSLSNPVEVAGTLSAAGRHKDAAAVLRPLVEAEPGNESLRFRLAAEQVFDGQTAPARENLQMLGKSWDATMAAKARASLAALDRSEAAEREAAKGTGGAAPDPAVQAELRARQARLDRQQRVFTLVAQKNNDAIVTAVDALASRGEATDPLLIEKAYALQRQGRLAEACDVLQELNDRGRLSDSEALTLAYLLQKSGRHAEAFAVFANIRGGGSDPAARSRAAAEIAALAPALNLDRHFWGELDLYATYLTRYQIGVASGRLREGTFVPGARWIEPFVQADFTLDTGSKTGEGITTIYNENLAGFHAGVRVRPFASQTFVLYVLGGVQKDLLGTEDHHGDWFAELIAGVNGWWAWGPGSRWLDVAGEQELTAEQLAMRPVEGTGAWSWQPATPFRLRLDWFAEAGGDAAYYTRLSDFLCYLQSRQGFRFLQCGRALSADAYVVENLTFDSAGNYYDNYFEAGPGVRLLAAPLPGAILSSNFEYLGGAYLGRNDNNSRGNAGATYSDFRITVSLSLRW